VPAGCPRGVAVHAHCRLAALELLSPGIGSCVEHASGRLLVERCALRCGEHPLAHFAAPILSTVGGASCAGDVLSVVDTRCEGGASAVRCEGAGVLCAVRVIYLARAAAFWFTVVPCARRADALRQQQGDALQRQQCSDGGGGADGDADGGECCPPGGGGGAKRKHADACGSSGGAVSA
jgi:hypothetical protein